MKLGRLAPPLLPSILGAAKLELGSAAMQWTQSLRQGPVGRRLVLGGLILGFLAAGLPRSAAAAAVGKAEKIRGNVRRRQGDDEERLATGGTVLDRDYVTTGTNSFADLSLSEARILLGPQTELLIDHFIAGQGGTLELGLGRMLFERPEGAPKTDVAVRTAFGMIGVRGTRFFCGPSRAAAFAVFVERGSVSVAGGGVTRTIGAGQGVDFDRPGAPPSEPANWRQARIREAYASVGLI